ncbi:hypothetical protein GCM10022252_76070 [Streptosporangium oxazolinicum]|uniref:IstB-like ATP-binding protein domain-containing protein n=1 Tax=Streptosporangium oxazolinicum TaxID=909287 RepID=A0ABP8BLQ4_9ACTN
MNQSLRRPNRPGIPVSQIETTQVGNNMARVEAVTGRPPTSLAPVLRGKAQLDPAEIARIEALYAESDRASHESALTRREEGRARLWHRRVPQKYRTATYDQFKPQQDPTGMHLATRTKTTNAVTAWLDGPHQGLLLKGPSRHGKSYAAYAIGHAARARGLYVSAWSMPILNKALRGDLGEKEGTAAWTDVLDSDLLYLDDIGRENVTRWTTEQLHIIAEHRLTTGDDDGDGGTRTWPRRTITSTNLGYSDLIELYGDPLVERLLEDAMVAVIEGQKLSAFATDPF